MKIIKKYLTSEELAFIVNTINQEEDLVTKEILKVALVAQCCIDEFQEIESGTTCNDIYDKIVSCDECDMIETMSTQIHNWYAIDNCCNNEIVDLVANFLSIVGNRIDKFAEDISNETLQNSIDQVKGMIE